jgi:hypothetical protein
MGNVPYASFEKRETIQEKQRVRPFAFLLTVRIPAVVILFEQIVWILSFAI